MSYQFRTSGVCAQKIDIDLEGDVIKEVKFYGGCNGNLKAIALLVAGKTIDEVSQLLEGNTCGFKRTSCADQLVKGLREAYASNNK